MQDKRHVGLSVLCLAESKSFPRRREFSEFVSYHLLSDMNRDVLPSVVHLESNANERGQDGARPSSGLNRNIVRASLIQVGECHKVRAFPC